MQDKYNFVARKNDVDYIRIVREAPKNTPFILVEEKNRKGQPRVSVLLIHKSVLSHHKLQGMEVSGESISPSWGHKNSPFEDKKLLYSYKYVVFQGKLPGFIKKEVESLRVALNPKDTKVLVTYL
jgi:hypothetical protein